MTDEKQQKKYKYYTVPQASNLQTQNTLALILAGGEGSRLKSLTKWRAKPAVPFGGKYRIIDFPLSNCINSGIRKIGVLTQYKSHSLLRHLQRAWGFLRAEIGEFVEIIPAQQRLKQEWYKGTADAVFQNMDIIHRHSPDYVIILGGDHIYTMDYSKMLKRHVDSGADLTVGCIEVTKEEAKDFGVMSVNEDFDITRFTEKPDNPETIPNNDDIALASMGIYIFSIEFMKKILIENMADPHTEHDFGKNIIPKSLKSGKCVAYPFIDEQGTPCYWRDVGSLYSYWKANMELCSIEPELNLYNPDWPIWTYQPQSPPAKFAFDDEERRGMAIDSLVAGGCIISGAKVKNSVIFFNTHIETGAYVKNSVILPKINIGKNCTIKNAIIDKGVNIPDNFEIGVDEEKDRERFLITNEGIVLVTLEHMNQDLYYEIK